jgi:hypothetical protein
MAVKSIQLGQVWKNESDGKNYLVTKVYNELFTQYVMLRPADASAPSSESTRVKVQKSTEGATIPGFAFTQETQDF